jgi:tetratricopeptide (TPR) repeat protein
MILFVPLLFFVLFFVFFATTRSFSETPSVKVKGEDDLFSMIPTTLIKSFQPALKAYNKGDVDRAIVEAKELLKKKELTETATALLGDFYLRRWEGAGSGEGPELISALNALEDVTRQYGGTENADLALLKRGNLYLSKQQYGEAGGSFTRVVLRHPQTPYAATAQVGLLEATRGLRRWDQIIRWYPRLSTFNPSLYNQQRGAFVYANTLFELGRFSESYAKYQFADALIPNSAAKNQDPESLFHYGEAAYRSGHQDYAKAIFKNVYGQFPDHKVAPMAMAFTSNIMRLEGETGQAQELADRLYFRQLNTPTERVGKIIAATGRLASLTCKDPCKSETIQQSIKHIETESKLVLLERPFTTTTQAAILDALVQMRRYITFDTAEELYEEMIPIFPVQSPYLPFAKSYLDQTVLEHFKFLHDPQQVITLFHRFRRTFSPAEMNSETGFKLAKSHMDVGLLGDAIEYFKPISANVKNPMAEEAFYNMGLLLAQMGRYSEAQNMLERFLDRYPKRTDVLSTLGNAYDVQGKTDLAINAYKKWLGYYPKHADRKIVYPKLASAYRLKKELDNEINLYLQWIKETEAESERPYIGLADAYYEKKLYKTAIETYEKALKVEKDKKDIDWAKLRIGASYLALGKKDDAGKIFQEVAKEAKTPIIKKTANETDAGLQQEKKRLQEGVQSLRVAKNALSGTSTPLKGNPVKKK